MSPQNQPAPTGLDAFSDLFVPVDVRIGERRMSVQDIVKLDIGSVIALDQPAGESLEVLIGNVKLASAEVVVVDDRLAVRITKLITCQALPLASKEAIS
jgi:flagellar motor switch protein FliN